MGAAVEALRIPAAQRPDLVDHPAFAPSRLVVCEHRTGSGMTKAVRLVDPFVEQQLDIVEQKLAAIRHRHLTRRPPGSNVGRLREDPWVAEYAAADKHTAHP